jgi:hypothetical protein
VTSDHRLIVWGHRGRLTLVEPAERSPKEYRELAKLDKIFSTEPISIVPHDVKLPTTIPDLFNPAAVETVAESTLKELEQDPAIAEFTRPLR